jgi:hypothetical protein
MSLSTPARVIAVGVVATAVACQPQVIGEALPGYVHIVSNPPQSASPLTIRFRDPGHGGVSTVSFDFAAGQRILIVFPSLTQVLGTHAVGAVHTDPQTEPIVDPID